jgi:hypothetical protein
MAKGMTGAAIASNDKNGCIIRKMAILSLQDAGKNAPKRLRRKARQRAAEAIPCLSCPWQFGGPWFRMRTASQAESALAN